MSEVAAQGAFGATPPAPGDPPDPGRAADIRPLAPGGRPPTSAERYEFGRARRREVQRTEHAGWPAPADRADPVAELVAADERQPDAARAERYARMVASPLAFLRGAAAVMARDLAGLPSSGIDVQLCGDANVFNFGLYAVPDGGTVFDLDDFTETQRGPFEWDVKRLAASVAVAAGDYGFSPDAARSAAQGAVVAYRNHVATYAGMSHLETWYARIDSVALGEFTSGRTRRALTQGTRPSRRAALPRGDGLVVDGGDGPRLADVPPLLVHDDRATDEAAERLAAYRASLPDHRRHLLDAYSVADAARLRRGMAGGGRSRTLLLLRGAHHGDVVLLQLAAAGPSVLAPYTRPGPYANEGRRVVEGQRLVQAAADIFLGWGRDHAGDFYLRHHRDQLGTFEVDRPTRTGLGDYARLCGWALARAHARSGQGAAISGYLGSSERFARAVATFALDYAEQTRRDHAALVDAVEDGRVEARPGR